MRRITKRLKTDSVNLAAVGEVVRLVRELEEGPLTDAGERELSSAAVNSTLRADVRTVLRRLEQ